MKNCLIMGFGRSGTSLMAGILHKSGYYMGEDLYPPRETNPIGFFENAFINGINERILEKYDASAIQTKFPVFDKSYSPYQPGTGHRWLSYIVPKVNIDELDPQIEAEIKQALSPACFAYKDPRFNYTLAIWSRFLAQDVVFICMFRQPEVVIESVIKECKTVEYLSNFYIDRDLAYQLWCNSYSHLMKLINTPIANRMIFIHYEQLLNKEAISILSGKLETNLDCSIVNPVLNRSLSSDHVPDEAAIIYGILCNLSGYKG